MTLQEQYELVKKAVDNNQLKELFLGTPGYEWGNLKHIPANVATDIGAIIDYGIYKLHDTGKTDVKNVLIRTIYELLNLDDAFATWTAYFILRYQYRNELKSQSPFTIVTPQLREDVANRVKNQKKQLSACKEYVGYGLTNGLWDDIQRLENVMISNYGESIL